MSNAVKTIIGVAAAVAVPFVAPYVATAFGTSLTVSSALAGAGLGAAGAAVTGGDVGRGALMGGIGGGIYGYTQPAAAAAGAAGAAPSVGLAPGELGMAGGVSGTPAATAGLSTATAPALAGAAPTTFTGALSQIPGAIAAKFTDPKALADMTLRAAGQLAGSAFAGEGLSEEEKVLLNSQTEELRNLQQTNKALFNQQLEQAQQLAGSTKYFDPEYFGLQAARRQQIAGVRATREATQGRTGEERANIQRRGQLATGLNTGTAFDVGYGQGVAGRQGAATSAMTAFGGLKPPTTDYNTMLNAEEYKRKAREREVGGVQTLFGSLTEQPRPRA
jgi:hypothetical protein